MKFCILLAGALAVLAQVPHQHHPPQSAEEYAKILEDPGRDNWQRPDEVIKALKLRPDEVVADIGAGSGYFTRRLARNAGKVFAVDIDTKLLDRIAKNAIPNIVTVHAEKDDPKLAPNSVDTIFICDVLHHIDNRPEYYAKPLKALKPDGRLVNIDFHKRDLPVGPPTSMKLSEEEVKKEMEAAGLVLTGTEPFLPHQYFLIFKRR